MKIIKAFFLKMSMPKVSTIPIIPDNPSIEELDIEISQIDREIERLNQDEEMLFPMDDMMVLDDP